MGLSSDPGSGGHQLGGPEPGSATKAIRRVTHFIGVL